jgi:hypothetical protein
VMDEIRERFDRLRELGEISDLVGEVRKDVEGLEEILKAKDERIGALERQVRNANAAGVLCQEVLAEALRKRSWAYVEGFVGHDGTEALDLEGFSRVAEVNYPGAAVEEVGDRKELVLYTGLRVDPDDGKVRRLTVEEVSR